MKNIKGLILKDLLNLSHYKTTLLITILIFGAITFFQKDFLNFLPTVIIIMIGMIALSTFSYDELSKSDKFLLTLPSNRREIVKAKYLLIIGFTILGAIFAFIINFGISYFIFKQSPDILGSLIFITGGLFGIGLVECIQIPSIYKWGAEKGRIQMFIVLAIIIAIVGTLIFFIMKNINLNIDLSNIENFSKNYGIPILTLITAMMYYISYKISTKIYSKKEI